MSLRIYRDVPEGFTGFQKISNCLLHYTVKL
uniref:Uncharacterized protein n=1 Tax=Myoviridae sp. ctqfO1 TaxID=2827710 RepID=A0A8S5T2C7_9CAUD|nr:MAG TPA: hypothetical protein [Myoviridae sp. ctqfO1]